MRTIIFVLSVLYIGSNIGWSQSREETLEYLETKLDVYKIKNNYGDLFMYGIGVKDKENGPGTNFIIFEQVAIADVKTRSNYYYSDIKNVTAIERDISEIGRNQIKIYASPDFTKLNFLDEKEDKVRVVTIELEKNISEENMKSLIKAFKHLVKISGGRDLSIEKF